MYIKLTKTRKIIRRIARVMLQVAAENKKLDMSDWYHGGNPKTMTIHTCTAPACVAGYAALDNGVCNLTEVNRGDACDLDMALSSIAKDEYNKYSLGNALFSSERESRFYSFKQCFPTVRASRFRALRVNKPTPLDVVELLNAIDELLARR